MRIKNILLKIGKWFMPPSNYGAIAGSFFRFFVLFLVAISLSLAIGFFYNKTSIINLKSEVEQLNKNTDSLRNDSAAMKKDLSLLREITSSDSSKLKDKLEREEGFKDSSLKAIKQNLLKIVNNYQTDKENCQTDKEKAKTQLQKIYDSLTFEDKFRQLDVKLKGVSEERLRNEFMDTIRTLRSENYSLKQKNENLDKQIKELQNPPKMQPIEDNKKVKESGNKGTKGKKRHPLIPNPFKKRTNV